MWFANAVPPTEFLIQWLVLPILALVAAVTILVLLVRRLLRKRRSPR